MAQEEGRPFLEHLESYLARRDGVDKLLKIARYAAKIAVAAQPSPLPDGALDRLRLFEASVGTSRKAFRLGKFVQDVNALLRASKSPHRDRQRWILELIAYGGEGLYYFVEQFVWLAKTGLINKHHSKKLQKISAWTEFVGYFGSVILKYQEISAMIAREKALIDAHRRHKREDAASREEIVSLKSQIQSLHSKRFLKTLSLIQDFADSLLALSDIRDGRGVLSAPLLLASAGLVSATISAHKNWNSC
ncbi:hypothetical protein SELMODRAFT_121160 [Selaginella moellendorffii]|uniref:Peroxisomal biogenesis factor 11 n=1 Tax=Selaginella moellendorffii TaxID=88036 RepID=D8SN45_SELML|nr:peroxisomal membrane protein 11A [Selaginella moellendorffii]EFJ13998.1 hypothetical protein SELMODRAFT_121160 [Selaginella moellendorffii]|eukprot:XP_002984748.1 peroxisomal membrane protein 11A [Selaginella moellendorffii]